MRRLLLRQAKLNNVGRKWNAAGPIDRHSKPSHVHAHLIGDLVVVRLKGVLTAAEQHLVKTLQPEKGRDLLKQVRSHLIETARPTMEAMVEGITGTKVVSLHHDISTAIGEEVVLFTLAEAPLFREAKKR